MPNITETAFAPLEAEHRLINAVFKDTTKKAGRFGFRGELALKFSTSLADEKRPPELKADQVMAVAENGSPTLNFFAGYLLSFASLKPLVEVLGPLLAADGKYFVFCNNLDLASKYRVAYGGTTFYVLPIDEATVYNEVLELLYLEKNDLKRLDTGAKLDAIADKAYGYSANFPQMTYEEGVQRMGEVRNPLENRPV